MHNHLIRFKLSANRQLFNVQRLMLLFYRQPKWTDMRRDFSQFYVCVLLNICNSYQKTYAWLLFECPKYLEPDKSKHSMLHNGMAYKYYVLFYLPALLSFVVVSSIWPMVPFESTTFSDQPPYYFDPVIIVMFLFIFYYYYYCRCCCCCSCCFVGLLGICFV